MTTSALGRPHFIVAEAQQVDGTFVYLVDTELDLADELPAVGCFDNCIDLAPGIVPVLEHRCPSGLGVDR